MRQGIDILCLIPYPVIITDRDSQWKGKDKVNTFLPLMVAQATAWLNKLIGQPNEFMADRLQIDRVVDSEGYETWELSAWNGSWQFGILWVLNGQDVTIQMVD